VGVAPAQAQQGGNAPDSTSSEIVSQPDSVSADTSTSDTTEAPEAERDTMKADPPRTDTLSADTTRTDTTKTEPAAAQADTTETDTTEPDMTEPDTTEMAESEEAPVTSQGTTNDPSRTDPETETARSDTTAPPPPSVLSTAVSGDTVRLTWATVADSLGPVQYRVYRDTTAIDSAAGPTSALLQASARADTSLVRADTSYVDSTAQAGGTYVYRVTAQDSVGNESAYSPEAEAQLPTSPPTTSANTQNTLWLGVLPWWGQLGGGAAILALLVAVAIYLRPREDEDLQKEDSFDVSLPDGTLQIGNAQHMGRRSEQQDAFGFSDPADEAAIEQKGLLAVVADGMGGMEKGASASNAAIQTLLDEHDRFDGAQPLPDWCRRAVGRANRSVLEIAEEAGLAGEVGTTLSAVLVQGNQLHWVNVGDSRVYLARNDELIQLTDDHIYARELQEKVKEGDMSAEEAIHHPERGALTSYLGMPEMKHIDQNERPFRLQHGDRLLICSDGLYDALEDEQLQAALELSPQEACTALLQQVVGEAEEHQDNATIMVLRYLDEGKTKSNDDD